MSESASPDYGSFSLRMVASSIDLGLLLVLVLPLTDWLMGRVFAPLDANRLMQGMDFSGGADDVAGRLLTLAGEQHLVARMVLENLLQLALLALYFLPFWIRFSSSPGKMLFRLSIRDAASLAPLTKRQAVVRFLGYAVSALPLSLGFLWILFNRKRQGWHDLLAHTVVIHPPKRDIN